MDKLRIEKSSRQVFDIEDIRKKSLYLKGIGRYCVVCGKHLFGRPHQKTCSNQCRNKKNYSIKKTSNGSMTLHTCINLKSQIIDNKKVRIATVYLKKGVIEQVLITPKAKELWVLLDKIYEFRTNYGKAFDPGVKTWA